MGSCLRVPSTEDADLEGLRQAVLEASTLREREDLILGHLTEFVDSRKKKDREMILATLAGLIRFVDDN